MIHNGYEWACSKVAYQMILDQNGNPPIGDIHLIQVGSWWTGVISLGESWYRSEVVLASRELALVAVESQYEALLSLMESSSGWKEIGDTLVSITDNGKGVIKKHIGRWEFQFTSDTVELVSLPTKEEALLIANLAMNSYDRKK